MTSNKTTEKLVQQAKQALNAVFGFQDFRVSQQAIIENVLKQHNTLAIMPTGGGKSLCYQIPAIVFDKLTIVISPLISLMQDQVRQLVEVNVSACVLNSSLSSQEYQQNLKQLQAGEIKLLFLAPETALQPAVLSMLQEINVACIAIDEAHCISEWGHEFRPEYRQLKRLLDTFPNAVVIALTATATERVRNDIKQQLNIDDGSEFIANFDRPNLFIEVAPKESPYQQTTAYINQHANQSGIIYCQSRAGVNELTAKLCQDGYSAMAYHAGLNNVKRSEHQEKFVRDDVNIIVATVAFGMGINKPDVRFVLHYDLPKNIESYYQQIGRAGRDGLDANCLLLFGYGDTGKIRFFIDQMTNEQEQRLATMHLNQMLALAETEDCRRIPLLQYFGEQNVSENCHKCDNCVGDKKEKSDLTVPAQKFLSCVHRTGQLFGASHIIDVLRGSNAEKVLQHQHNLLSTYNIGNEFTKKQWMALARQLIQKELLRQDEKYGSLKLTQKAADVLKGKVPFFALLQQAMPTKVSSKNDPLLHGDQVLVQLLKTERKHLADNANLPPYAVFSDRSLQEMAHYLPHSCDSFLQIHGVGQAKVDKYGELFTTIIKDYCKQHSLQEKTNGQTSSKRKQTGVDELTASSKCIEIAKQFDKGLTVLALSQKHKVKPNTIYQHLYKFVQTGNKFTSAENLVNAMEISDELLHKGLDACKEHSTERLKPLYDALQEEVSYDQLHLLRVYFLHMS